MAEQIHIELIDDLDGSNAAETVSFSLDGVTYDIDLNEQNAQKLREVLAHYTQAGRTMTHAAATTRREEQQKHRTRQANKAHTHNIRQAADAARHPRRPPQPPAESLHRKAEPTIAAVITVSACLLSTGAPAERSSDGRRIVNAASSPPLHIVPA